jgi:hypothetical protein
MPLSVTEHRQRRTIDPGRTRAKMTEPLKIDDEAAGWLAPETIVAHVFHRKDPIGQRVRSQRKSPRAATVTAGSAMSIAAVVFTAAILLTLLV